MALSRPITGARLFLRPLSTSSPRLKADNSKRSTSSGVLQPPKLDYDVLVHPSQATNAAQRNAPIPERTFVAIRRDLEAWRATTRNADALRAQQAKIGEEVRTTKSEEDKQIVTRRARALRDTIQAHERELARLEHSLLSHSLRIPNTSHPDSPIGPEPNARLVSTHGPPAIPAEPRRDHNALNDIPGMKFFDREAGVVSSGSGFAYLRGGGALLEVALVGYAMEIACKHGFEPVITPDVVKRDVADRCGFVPRDGDPLNEGAAESVPEQMYGVQSHHGPAEGGLVLAGTAEIPLAALHANALYNPQELPRRTVAVGHAFRAEAGARGRDTRGLYRVHQFTKVELFSVTTGETRRQQVSTEVQEKASDRELEYLRKLQIELYESLGLTFRVLDMPTEELGASAHRKYDIEAWMPGRGAWGEISSVSNCTDFQARRLHIRHRHLSEDSTGPLPYAHTLNGTAAAIPRLVLALLENRVRFGEGGGVEGVVLPGVLRRHWVGGDRFGNLNIEWS
ncbi:Serine--tRNA ligase, mitochondrial [Ceratobasidium sp. UAMH 11750]|nr:Serine--tRNA ligase, mitochondrial [Ceratobasidium sp. UAMH 11750]